MEQLFSSFGRNQRAAGVLSEENPGFFEAFANGGDVVGEAARGDLQPLVRLRFGEPCHTMRGMILGVERAAGKDIRAAEERGGLNPLQHEHFETVPQQDERRRRPWNARHQTVRPARSFSFAALIIARMRAQSASVSLSSAT
jgi:hypothetical protein